MCAQRQLAQRLTWICPKRGVTLCAIICGSVSSDPITIDNDNALKVKSWIIIYRQKRYKQMEQIKDKGNLWS
jgi:hypothetical protein